MRDASNEPIETTVDLTTPMSHSSHAMRIFRLTFALFFFAAVTAPAQTNAGRERPVRELSLQDCIQMSLENGLKLKIARYEPQFAIYNLGVAYAGYDPAFTLSGAHSFNLTRGGLNPSTGLISPTRTTDANSFSSRL